MRNGPRWVREHPFSLVLVCRCNDNTWCRGSLSFSSFDRGGRSDVHI